MPKARELNIQNTIGDVIADLRKPKLHPETGWFYVGGDPDVDGGVPFEGSWDNVLDTLDGKDYAPAAWHLSHHGEVRNQGVVDGGAVGDVIFIYPEETRPKHSQVFSCAIIGGGTANVRVDPDGTVTLESIS